MKLKKIFAPLFAVSMFGGAVACETEKTDEGELPEVEYKGGDMPNYEVETPDVDVPDVEAPDVDVDTETETIEVPDVDVNEDETRE